MSELDDRLRRDFLAVRERVERLALPDISDREPSANQPRVLAVVRAAIVVVLIAGAAVVVVRSRSGEAAHPGGVSSSGPTSTGPTSPRVPSGVGVHTVLFAGGGRIQELDIDAGGPPTALPVTGPASLGGRDAPLVLSQPAIDRSHTRIAFVVGAARSPGTGAIAVANVDGSSSRDLTDGPNDAAPAWSGNGNQIAFLRATSGTGPGTGATIWTMDADGSHERSLGVDASSVSWSPDGTTLAIRNIGEPVRMGLLTIATGKVRWLTPGDASVEQFTPAWSPDGGHIAYGQTFAHASEPAGLFVANSDGSDARRLTSCRETCEDDSTPSWSSDGAAVAFVRYLTSAPASPQVYVVAASGGAVRQLTSGPQPHDSPTW